MRWDDMSPEEQTAHMEYVRSEQGMKDMEERRNKLEAICDAVSIEEAAERELQEVVWADGDVIRFRENVKVTQMLGPDPSDEPVEQWMVEQFSLLTQEGEAGNGVVRWLVENGPADMNLLAEQGMLELNGRGFSQRDKEQFVMLIGYSVSAGGGLSYFSSAMCQRADEAADKLRLEKEA